MSSNIYNATSNLPSRFMTFYPSDTSSPALGRQNERQPSGTPFMAPQSPWESAYGLTEDEGYASASLSPAPEEQIGSVVHYVPETNQQLQNDVKKTEARNEEDHHSVGAADASGEEPSLDGPCDWSEEEFSTLVNLLAETAGIMFPEQSLAMPLIPDIPVPSSAEFLPSYNLPAGFPSTSVTSPGAGTSNIPQDAFTISADQDLTHQQSSKKRSRSEDTYEAPLHPPLKKTRAAAYVGEVLAQQTPVNWSDATLVMVPYYVQYPIAGPSNFMPWPQSVMAEDADNREALEQSLEYQDIQPETNGGQAPDPFPNTPQVTKRFRRTNAEIAPTLIPGIKKKACGFPGCQKTLHPKSGENNRNHFKGVHYTVDTLNSEDLLVCRWAACGKSIKGKTMMAHIEANHIGFGYRCLVPDCRLDWKGCRAKDHSQHMKEEHAGWRG
ncbi:uncharacterized protein TRAVEDRAFT_50460 [Trametes versicolor FP-101664 SS1]|uniref:uncharacterized protein n=1 Tax=Trametes versicolor (strain FP-101664) TaxID=717944 RepID=UPI000462273F|nr:uncharacterized protein TRAVEDRAFT_50460 [Trametes versicolor FP-101664 SS1]EIW55970.1 hypothetical protein TRAVEDRAFT_50460 [Trametes versicolor FP-101664 SS1]